MPDVIDYVRGVKLDPLTGQWIKRVETSASGAVDTFPVAASGREGTFAPGFGSNLNENIQLYPNAAPSSIRVVPRTTSSTLQHGDHRDFDHVKESEQTGSIRDFEDWMRAAKTGISTIGTLGPIEAAVELGVGMIDPNVPGSIDPNDTYGNANAAPGYSDIFKEGVRKARAAGVRSPNQISQYAQDYVQNKFKQNEADAAAAGKRYDLPDGVGMEEGDTLPAKGPNGENLDITKGYNRDPSDTSPTPAGNPADDDVIHWRDPSNPAPTTPPGGEVPTITRGTPAPNTGGGGNEGGGGGPSGADHMNDSHGGGFGGGMGGGHYGMSTGGTITKQQGAPAMAFPPKQSADTQAALGKQAPKPAAPKPPMAKPAAPKTGILQQMAKEILQLTGGGAPPAMASGGTVTNSNPTYAGGGTVLAETPMGPGNMAPHPEGTPMPPQAKAPAPMIGLPDGGGADIAGGGAPADDGRFNPTPEQIADDGVVDNQDISADEGEGVLQVAAMQALGQDFFNELNDPATAAQWRQIFDEVKAMGGGGASPSAPADAGSPPADLLNVA